MKVSIGAPSTMAKRLARHFTSGRSRVLTPVPPDQVWVFFKGFPTPSHRGMSHITDTVNAGSVPTTFLPHPSSPYPSRIFPSMWLQKLWKALATRPPSGAMKDVSFPVAATQVDFISILIFISFVNVKSRVSARKIRIIFDACQPSCKVMQWLVWVLKLELKRHSKYY
jgi:hypothetical protein